MAEPRVTIKDLIAAARLQYKEKNFEHFEGVLQNALGLNVGNHPSYQEELVQVYDLLIGHYVSMACTELAKDRGEYEQKLRDIFALMDSAKLDSNTVQHLVCCGFGLIFVGSAEKAEGLFLSALRIMPKCVPALLGRGILAFSREEYKKTLGYFKSVLMIQPHHSTADVRVSIAQCFIKLGDLERARKAFSLAVLHNSRSVNALIGFAQLKLNERRPESTKEGMLFLGAANELNPRHPLVLTWLAGYYYYTRDYEKVKLIAGNAYKITDDPLLLAENAFQIARCFHAEKNYDQAFNFYGLAVRNAPRDYVPPHLGIVQMYVHRNLLKKAEETLVAVIRRWRLQPEALRLLGIYHLQCGKWSESLLSFKFAAHLAGLIDDPDILIGMATVYVEKELWELALNAYKKARQILEEKGQEVPLLLQNNVAATQFYCKQLEDALQTINAVKPMSKETYSQKYVESNTLTLRYNRARVLEELHRNEEAEHQYKELMFEYPEFYDSYIRLGVMAAKCNKIETAIKYFQDVIQRDRDNKMAKIFLGNLYCRQDMLTEALQHYNEIRRHPVHQNDHHVLLGLGNALTKRAQKDRKYSLQEDANKHQENSMMLFREALKTNKRNLWAANGIGVSFCINGYLADGEIALRQVVNADKRCTDALLNLANVMLAQKRYEEAIPLYKECLELDVKSVNNVQTLQYLARALYESKQFKEAKDALMRARHIMPQDLRIMYNLAVVLKTNAEFVLKSTSTDLHSSAREELEIARCYFAYLVQENDEWRIARGRIMECDILLTVPKIVKVKQENEAATSNQTGIAIKKPACRTKVVTEPNTTATTSKKIVQQPVKPNPESASKNAWNVSQTTNVPEAKKAANTQEKIYYKGPKVDLGNVNEILSLDDETPESNSHKKKSHKRKVRTDEESTIDGSIKKPKKKKHKSDKEKEPEKEKEKENEKEKNNTSKQEIPKKTDNQGTVEKTNVDSSVKKTTKQDISIKEIPKENKPVKETPKKGSQVKEIPKVDSSVRKQTKENISKKDSPKEDKPITEIPKKNSPVVEISKMDSSSKKKKTTEHIPEKNQPKENNPVKEIPKKDSAVKEIPKKDSPVENISKEDSSLKKKTKEHSSKKDKPKEAKPVKEIPKKDSPVNEIPKDDSFLKTKEHISVNNQPKVDKFVMEIPKKASIVRRIPKEDGSVKEKSRKSKKKHHHKERTESSKDDSFKKPDKNVANARVDIVDLTKEVEAPVKEIPKILKKEKHKHQKSESVAEAPTKEVKVAEVKSMTRANTENVEKQTVIGDISNQADKRNNEADSEKDKDSYDRTHEKAKRKKNKSSHQSTMGNLTSFCGIN